MGKRCVIRIQTQAHTQRGAVDCLGTSGTYHALLKEITRRAVDVNYNARVSVCPIISISQSSFRLVRYVCGIVYHELGTRYVRNTRPERGRWFVHGSSFGETAPARLRSLRMKKVTEKKIPRTQHKDHTQRHIHLEHGPNLRNTGHGRFFR
jgi:hypothetical protein